MSTPSKFTLPKNSIVEKAKQLNASANAKIESYLLGSISETKDDAHKDCICGSDLYNQIKKRSWQFKWMTIVIVVLIAAIILIMYFTMERFGEPLYDSGIGQRRQIQLDGLGSEQTFNERMQFTTDYQPEYTD